MEQFELALSAAARSQTGERRPCYVWDWCFASCLQRDRQSAPVAFDGAMNTDERALIRHGERLTQVLGCTGCHRSNLEGGRFFELYASNLTRELPHYSDAQFDNMLRGAERPNGKVVLAGAYIFQHLSAPDETALLAYLRTLSQLAEFPPGDAPAAAGDESADLQGRDQGGSAARRRGSRQASGPCWARL